LPIVTIATRKTTADKIHPLQKFTPSDLLLKKNDGKSLSSFSQICVFIFLCEYYVLEPK
jgi:hypothetical protein